MFIVLISVCSKTMLMHILMTFQKVNIFWAFFQLLISSTAIAPA